MDVTRTLLIESSVPSKYWVKEFSFVVYLINRFLSKVMNLGSPIFRLCLQNPTIVIFICLVVFILCICLFRNAITFMYNLLNVILRVILHDKKGFICYYPCSHKFHISRNVVFFKNRYFFHTIVDSSSSSPIFLLLRIYHLILRGSKLDLCMNDVGQLYPISVG